ncbi:MAG: Biotin carboxylase of acetyl-CoA carboxylase [Ignavibacteriae bacterium]|nr:MAG: Biotin carboxylase of acetyl-CoA carboxylase [Ignavibacteriota bacterium]
MKKIKKILIANRGEIAVRVIRTCKDLGIRTVSVYSEIDQNLPHVRLADEAYCIGRATPAESYLNKQKIIDIALKAQVDAIHPGYGFLSENSEFSKMVQDAGIIFIGPPPEAIEKMGDKISARRLVSAASIPVVPGTDAPVMDLNQAIEFGRKYGYPILLKAAGGGGGKGMRIVKMESELTSALRSAQSEAQTAFGDNRIYIEKYLENPRHIEFQILCDSYGNGIHLGERECSIQRRHQKIIEESPSVIMTPELRDKMGRAAVKAALSANYRNAGTIEFLVDKQSNFYFLEMNTRLQVEHPVTEMVTQIDIVKEQINIAEGNPLSYSQSQINFRGHAIECRIYAEDYENNFLPSIGKIKKLKSAAGAFIREDRGVDEGNEISVYYDPMISKLIAWGETRDIALKRMQRALEEYKLAGIKTNINACKWILNHKKFVEGDFDTHFIENYYNPEIIKNKRDEIIEAIAIISTIYLNNQKASYDHTIKNKDVSKWKSKKLEYFR